MLLLTMEVESMSEPSDDSEKGNGINPDLAAAILGANCNTGMAVAVGLAGFRLAAAFPCGGGSSRRDVLRRLIGEW